MYTSFTAENYRCFEDLTIEPLGRINLITGKNNIGKTTLLEALFIHSGAYNPALTLNVNAFRGIEPVKVDISRRGTMPWALLFANFDISKTIKFKSVNTQTGQREIKLRVIDDPLALSHDELAGITSFVPEGTYDRPDASSFVPILELAYNEPKREGKVFLVIDSRGILSIPVPPPPPFLTHFQGARRRTPFAEEAELFGKLELVEEQDILLQALKRIEPRLKRLMVIVEGGEPIIHGDIGLARKVPLAVMGEGMARLASLILHMSMAAQGIVLIDEIENGLHYSVLPSVWQVIAEGLKLFDTQLFATTHSFECIRAAYETLGQNESHDFRLHRLEQIDGNIQALTINRFHLATAIESGWEVR